MSHPILQPGNGLVNLFHGQVFALGAHFPLLFDKSIASRPVVVKLCSDLLLLGLRTQMPVAEPSTFQTSLSLHEKGATEKLDQAQEAVRQLHVAT